MLSFWVVLPHCINKVYGVKWSLFLKMMRWTVIQHCVIFVKLMTPEQLSLRIESLAPGTKVEVTDLTGTMNHYQVTVISDAFEGKTMMQQHKMIMATLQAEIDSDEVHALSMRTYTPSQWAKKIPS